MSVIEGRMVDVEVSKCVGVGMRVSFMEDLKLELWAARSSRSRVGVLCMLD